MTTTYGAIALVLMLVVVTTVYVAAPQAQPPESGGNLIGGTPLGPELPGRWVRLSPEAAAAAPLAGEVQIIDIRADGTFRCEVRSTIETFWAEGTCSQTGDTLRFHITASGFPEGVGESVEARLCVAGSYLRLQTEGHGLIQSCDLARIGDAPL